MSEGNNPFRIASPKPARQPKDLRKSPPSMQQSDPKIEAKMKQIKYKIAILSGKGGVGKSFVSSNLAMAIAASGNKVRG